MVSCSLTTDEIPLIILNEKDCNATSGSRPVKIQWRCEKNKTTSPAVGFSSLHPPPPKTCVANTAILTTTRHQNFIRYFTKFTAITIAAAHVASLASAFTQPQGQKGAASISSCTSLEWQHLSLFGNKLSSVDIVQRENPFRTSLSSSSSSRLLLSTDNKSSAAVDSTKSDQQECGLRYLASF